MPTDKQLQKKITELGLEESEAVIYVYLLENGGGYPSRIAKETGLNRSKVYRVLTRLTIKGLVVEIEKKNKLFYQLEPPKSLLRYTDMQITLAKEKKGKAEQLFPDIEALFQSLPHKPKIRFFEGLENITKVYDDVYSQPGSYEIVGWSNINDLQLKLGGVKVLNKYIKILDKKDLTLRAFYPRGEGNTPFKKTLYSPLKEKNVPQTKYFEAKDFPYQSQISIYGSNRVAVINAHKEVPVAFIVEDQIFHNMMKMIFNFSWASYKE
ncbi:helix-turn-helix domain-containing protein [Patescibacteria group bacterium]|nr:helix-turn-helix domain-containing protein [Patescibacteria group bacterium]MBU1721825.1 helix-turn-helix domain-containing protein [Patescibacteria group bacterium]MBU1901680.1 helix-turn-helix domain-containing protein [Patescibacteria group bacterium]